MTSEGTIEFEEVADLLRRRVVEGLHKIGEGHFGGCLSVLEILLLLYDDFIDRKLVKRGAKNRDRLVLSKGHAVFAQYCILDYFDLLNGSELSSYGSLRGLQGHPDMLSEPAIDFSTGSLGQGLSVAIGMALVTKATVWVILGDGECQEGQVWEAAMYAQRLNHHLTNLVAIVDCNGFQEYMQMADVASPVSQMALKWTAFGWNVFEVDGHSYTDMRKVFTKARASAPSVILARTVKGKGYKLLESDPQRFHCGSLTDAEFEEIFDKELTT